MRAAGPGVGSHRIVVYYRGHHREFSLAHRLGAEHVAELIGRFFEDHATEIAVQDADQAAFLVGRGISAIVRLAYSIVQPAPAVVRPLQAVSSAIP